MNANGLFNGVDAGQWQFTSPYLDARLTGVVDGTNNFAIASAGFVFRISLVHSTALSWRRGAERLASQLYSRSQVNVNLARPKKRDAMQSESRNVEAWKEEIETFGSGPGVFGRRGVLLGIGAAGLAAVTRRVQAAAPAPDHTIRIAPVSLEIAPGKVIKTTAYNGTVPGPALRLREGRRVAINVINEAGQYYSPARSPDPVRPRRRHRGWLANHSAWAIAALHIYPPTHRHALVSQPRHGDD